MNPITFSSRATAAVVAGVAGFSSYRHIVEVAQRAGEHASVAVVLPLSIDGLIVVGTMAMVEDKRAGRRPRLSARVALGVGVVATLAANIASAQPHLMARLVAAVPAVAFLITVEVLARTGRIRDTADAVEVAPDLAPPGIDHSATPSPTAPVFLEPDGVPETLAGDPVVDTPEPDEGAGSEGFQDVRSKPEIETVVRAIKGSHPDWGYQRIADVALTSKSNVGRILRTPRTPDVAQLNGHKPELAEEVG